MRLSRRIPAIPVAEVALRQPIVANNRQQPVEKMPPSRCREALVYIESSKRPRCLMASGVPRSLEAVASV
jgi:hypothetical protein